MDQAKFEELLSLGHETKGVEFKGPGSRHDKTLATKVVRACLGMANLQGGGTVVLGVDEAEDKSLIPVGLSPEDAATWSHDDVADMLATYADPYISIDVQDASLDGKLFKVIVVDEFENIPLICKKEYIDPIARKYILRKGACYFRTRGKPETTDIATGQALRDLLEMATNKGIAKFISRSVKVGLLLPARAEDSDDESFKSQVKDLLE
jgi:hypothetical protein